MVEHGLRAAFGQSHVVFLATRGIGVTLDQNGCLGVFAHHVCEFIEAPLGRFRQRRGVDREQDVTVEIDAKGFLVKSLDVHFLDLLEVLLLFVHVNADSGTKTRTDRGRAQNFIQFPVTYEKPGERADSRADRRALLGLRVGVVG